MGNQASATEETVGSAKARIEVKRFEKDDRENWLKYLKEEGYVVIKGAADDAQVAEGRRKFWKLFEEKFGVRENDLDSWDRWYIDRRGISLDPLIMQSEGAWYIRSLPSVREAFAAIWDDADLVVSMDSVLLWKPWWANDAWLPKTEGLHVDQNPCTNPEFECVQGMLPLYDVTEAIGGLEVVPGSHLTHFPQFAIDHPEYAEAENFVPLPSSHPAQGTASLLTAQAGDLILWDSRTIHGGLVGTADQGNPPKDVLLPRLARLTVTICMLPRKRASQEALEERQKGFEVGYGFNHLPTEANVTAVSRNKGYQPIQLTDEQKSLL